MKLKRFKKGEHFSRFCERFEEYTQTMKIKAENMHILFLQYLDDETYAKLKRMQNLNEE